MQEQMEAQLRQPNRMLFEILALMAFQLLLLWGFWNRLDLSAGDEGMYYGAGRLLAAGDTSHWRPDWSPVYVLVYALLQWLPLGGCHAIDAMLVVTAVGSTLALWWALRPMLSAPALLLACAWWSSLRLVIGVHFHGYTFSMILCSLACGAFLRRRFGTAILFMVVSAVNRTEVVLWWGTLAALLLLPGGRMDNLGIPRNWRLGIAVAVLGTVLVLALDQSRRDRSWTAFQQHYALTLEERHGELRLDGVAADPWGDADQIAQQSFPTAESIGGAILANPGEATRHFLHNLAGLPRAFTKFLKPFTYCKPFKNVLLVLVILLWASALWRYRAHLSGLVRLLPGEAWLLVCASLPQIGVLVLLHPRPELLAAVAAVVFLVLAKLAAAGVPARADEERLSHRFTWKLVMPLLLVGSILGLVVPRQGGDARATMTVRTAVEILNKHCRNREGVLLGMNSPRYAQMADCDRLQTVEPIHAARRQPQTPAEMLRAHNPEFVLWTSRYGLSQELNDRLLRILEDSRSWRLVAERDGVRLFERVGKGSPK